MRRLILLLVVCAAAAQWALAQDQLAAIRAACTEDAQTLCAGVQPGGAESRPASKSTRTCRPIAANRPPVWLRTQLDCESRSRLTV